MQSRAHTRSELLIGLLHAFTCLILIYKPLFQVETVSRAAGITYLTGHVSRNTFKFESHKRFARIIESQADEFGS